MNYEHVQAGDKVIRMLAGVVRMELTVTEVTETEIIAGWWKFDRHTGSEIDEDLDWGPPPRKTGSFLITEGEDNGAEQACKAVS